MIMLIQQAEKKEKSSSKRYEMSFGNAILMTNWNTVYCHHVLYSIEIVDDPQTNDELNTFSNFFTQGTNL